jgi:mannose-6-phosphate isomerase-like protein (cupin superfamily)
MTEAWHLTLAATHASLPAAGKRWVEPLRHGTMRLGLYAPTDPDGQTPHRQDEMYIVAAGCAGFVRGDDRREVSAGDALFVPAGMPHRFERMSADFAAWVLFWGPDGGEPGNPPAAA